MKTNKYVDFKLLSFLRKDWSNKGNNVPDPNCSCGFLGEGKPSKCSVHYQEDKYSDIQDLCELNTGFHWDTGKECMINYENRVRCKNNATHIYYYKTIKDKKTFLCKEHQSSFKGLLGEVKEKV